MGISQMHVSRLITKALTSLRHAADGRLSDAVRGVGGAAAAAAAGAEVVADDVPAEVLGVGGEDPAAAAPGHRVDEPPQARVVAEHEHVDRRAVAGQRVDLARSSRRIVSGRGGQSKNASPSSAAGARSARRR